MLQVGATGIIIIIIIIIIISKSRMRGDILPAVYAY
jgi:hypothetical protein